MDTTKLRGIELWIHLGVPPDERRAAQRVLVDVELRHPLHDVAAQDDVTRGIDYAAVTDTVQTSIHGETRTLEAVAEKIATAILRTHRPAGGVTVTVYKQPRLALHDVSVSIHRP